MPNCPRCHQPVDSKAVSCPYCHIVLKAFGHQGIPLYRAKGETFLCDTCTYDKDDTCTFPQRPYAKSCTLYQDISQPLTSEFNSPRAQSFGGLRDFRAWCRRNGGLLLLVCLIVVSFLIALN